MKRITILHYAAPPTVGGVETTIAWHASLLTDAGYEVKVLTGKGSRFDPRVVVKIVPEVSSRHPEVLAVKEELDQGYVSQRFERLRNRLVESLRPYISATDVFIAHNVFTLHKNLPLTAALYRILAEESPDRPHTIAWHHDLAWRDPQYADEVQDGYPWDLLRQPWPEVINVTVSEARRRELADLYGIPPGSVRVVPPGIDVPSFFGWTETTRRIVESYGLLDADLVLLLPARITRRKNIQLAVRALDSLRRRTGLDARLIVTGPPGPHNPSNVAYLEDLLALRRDLDLEQAAHFVYELGAEEPLVPDDATMANLYFLADALLFPSRREGFGIPMLEAGLARLPIFCSDIPPLRATGEAEAHYFAPDADYTTVADLITRHLLTDPAFRLRHRVFREYRWERILRDRIIPLIESHAFAHDTNIGAPEDR